MEDSRALISHNVKHLRVRCGMTQEDLAFASGITTACISRLERCPGNPTVQTLDHISDALKIKMVQLLDEDLASPAGKCRTELERFFRLAQELPIEKQEELVLLIRNFVSLSKLI